MSVHGQEATGVFVAKCTQNVQIDTMSQAANFIHTNLKLDPKSNLNLNLNLNSNSNSNLNATMQKSDYESRSRRSKANGMLLMSWVDCISSIHLADTTNLAKLPIELQTNSEIESAFERQKSELSLENQYEMVAVTGAWLPPTAFQMRHKPSKRKRLA